MQEDPALAFSANIPKRVSPAERGRQSLALHLRTARPWVTLRQPAPLPGTADITGVETVLYGGLDLDADFIPLLSRPVSTLH